MQKYNNAILITATKLAQAIAMWYISVALTNTNVRVEVVLLSFAFIWLGTDVVIWVLKYIVQPTAKAIYESSK